MLTPLCSFPEEEMTFPCTLPVEGTATNRWCTLAQAGKNTLSFGDMFASMSVFKSHFIVLVNRPNNVIILFLLFFLLIWCNIACNQILALPRTGLQMSVYSQLHVWMRQGALLCWCCLLVESSCLVLPSCLKHVDHDTILGVEKQAESVSETSSTTVTLGLFDQVG